MTRQEAEECMRDRLPVLTHYGIGKIKSLCEKGAKCEWVEVKLDDPDRDFENPRCLFLSGICRYAPEASVELSGDRKVNNIF